MTKKWLIAALMLFVNCASLFSEQHEELKYKEEDNHTLHRHHAGVFAGATTYFEEEKTYFTLGIDYEYRLPILHNKFGIGLMGEMVFGEENEYIAGVPVFFHLSDWMRVFVAPSLLFLPEEIELVEGIETTIEAHSKYITVAGLFVDIHMRGFTISPTVKVEFIGSNIGLAYGLTFAKGF